ncbi:hypothetical protein AB0K48_04350 [Nonomuraea sp. NPDC055795]
MSTPTTEDIFDLDIDLIAGEGVRAPQAGVTNYCGINSWGITYTCAWSCTGRTGVPCAC